MKGICLALLVYAETWPLRDSISDHLPFVAILTMPRARRMAISFAGGPGYGHRDQAGTGTVQAQVQAQAQKISTQVQ